MKVNALLLVLAFIFTVAAKAQTASAKLQYIQPAELAALLTGEKKNKPVIFNTGPMADIKGAIKTGPASTAEGVEQLKLKLAGIAKDRVIIVYCGCCTSDNCPNIRPAFELLQQLGYKNAKCLFIEHGFQEDWAGKGYPVES